MTSDNKSCSCSPRKAQGQEHENSFNTQNISLSYALASSDWEVIPLKKEYKLNHGPLEGFSSLLSLYSWSDGELSPNYRQDPVSKIASFIQESTGGSLLVSGYRGVGKSSTVNRALLQVNSLARRTRCFIDHYLVDFVDEKSFPKGKKEGSLLKELINCAETEPTKFYHLRYILHKLSLAVEVYDEIGVCALLSDLYMSYSPLEGKRHDSQQYLFKEQSEVNGKKLGAFTTRTIFKWRDQDENEEPYNFVGRCRIPENEERTFRRSVGANCCHVNDGCFMNEFFRITCRNKGAHGSGHRCEGCIGTGFDNNKQYIRVTINLNTTTEADSILKKIISEIYLLTVDHKILSAEYLDGDSPDNRGLLRLIETTYKRCYAKEVNEIRKNRTEQAEISLFGRIGLFKREGESNRTTTEDLPYSHVDAQQDIKKILRKFPPHLRLIFVFDELDKLQVEMPDEASIREEDERKRNIENALSLLKPVLTESRAHFIFVAGKDTGVRWIEDLSKGAGLYESVFSQHVYVPSLFRSHTHIRNFSHKVAEEYLLSNIDFKKREKRSFRGLSEFERDFARYLTFKSRGIRRKALKEMHRYTFWVKGAENNEKENTSRAFLIFRIPDIEKIRFYSKVEKTIETIESKLVALDDKSTIAIYYMVDFIFKFYKTGFNIIDIETSSAILEHTETAPSRDLIRMVIDCFLGKFLIKTSGALTAYRFRVMVTQEIDKLIHYTDEEHSEFHFTNQDFLELSKSLERFDKEIDTTNHLMKITPIRVFLSLGELYFRTGDFNKSMIIFLKAIRLVNITLDNYSYRKRSREGLETANLYSLVYILVRANIFIGNIYEEDSEYSSALRYYSTALKVIHRYREVSKTNAPGLQEIAFDFAKDYLSSVNSNKKTKIRKWLRSNSRDILSRSENSMELFHILNLIAYVNYKKGRFDISLRNLLYALMESLHKGEISASSVQADRIGDLLFNYRCLSWAMVFYLFSSWFSRYESVSSELRGRVLSDLMNALIVELCTIEERVEVSKVQKMSEAFYNFTESALRNYKREGDIQNILYCYKRGSYFFCKLNDYISRYDLQEELKELYAKKEEELKKLYAEKEKKLKSLFTTKKREELNKLYAEKEEELKKLSTTKEEEELNKLYAEKKEKLKKLFTTKEEEKLNKLYAEKEEKLKELLAGSGKTPLAQCRIYCLNAMRLYSRTEESVEKEEYSAIIIKHIRSLSLISPHLLTGGCEDEFSRLISSCDQAYADTYLPQNEDCSRIPDFTSLIKSSEWRDCFPNDFSKTTAKTYFNTEDKAEKHVVLPVILSRRLINRTLSYSCNEKVMKFYLENTTCIRFMKLIRCAECGNAAVATNRMIEDNPYRAYKKGGYHILLGKTYLQMTCSVQLLRYFKQEDTDFKFLGDKDSKNKATLFFLPYFAQYKVLNIGSLLKLITKVATYFDNVDMPENTGKQSLDNEFIKKDLIPYFQKMFAEMALEEFEKAMKHYWKEFEYVRNGYVSTVGKSYLEDSFENSFEHDEIAKHMIARGKTIKEGEEDNNSVLLSQLKSVENQLLDTRSILKSGSGISAIQASLNSVCQEVEQLRIFKGSMIYYDSALCNKFDELYTLNLSRVQHSVFNRPTVGPSLKKAYNIVSNLIEDLDSSKFPTGFNS